MNINRIFIFTMGFAALAALSSVLLHLPVPVVLLFDLLPLCIYFSSLYRHGKNGLSHTAIDSVYYFGFIITILSLTGSVMRIWLFGVEKDMGGLIAQFGVGLLATGLALVFRLILIARVESMNAKDLTQTIEEYVQRIDNVVSKVEASAASFEGLSQSLQERTRAVVQATFEECTSSMRATTLSFTEAMSTVSEQVTTSSTSFGEVVRSLANATHVQELDANIEELNMGLKGFAVEVSKYGRLATDEALKTTKQALDASSKWHVDNLNSISNASQQSIQVALKALSDVDLGVDTSKVKGDLMGLSRAVTSFTKRFAELDEKLVTSNAQGTVQVLIPVIDDFSQKLARVVIERDNQMLEQFNNLSEKINDVLTRCVAAMNTSLEDEKNMIVRIVGENEKIIVAQSDQIFSRLAEETAKGVAAIAHAFSNESSAFAQVVAQRDKYMLDQFDDLTSRVNEESAKGIAAVNEALKYESKREVEVLTQRVERLVSAIEMQMAHGEQSRAQVANLVDESFVGESHRGDSAELIAVDLDD